MKSRLAAGLIVVLVLIAGGLGALRLGLSTDITHFLPAGADQGGALVSRTLANSELARTLIISLEARTPEDCVAASAKMEARLETMASVKWVRGGVDAGIVDAVRALYFPRRYYFAAEDPSVLDARLSPDGLRAAVAELKRQLGLPTSTMIRGFATQDPLLTFMAQLERFEGARSGSLSVRESRFISDDGRYCFLFLATRASPFAGSTQAAFLAELEAQFAETRAEVPGLVSMEESGAHRFAADSERSIKNDITRISVVSTIAILLLFFMVFRSPRVLVLAAVPVLCGIAGAVATCSVIFGTIHGVTLAFGCAMIGVCVDYGVHLLNHHALAPSETTSQTSLREVWPGLLLGALTTIAGVFALMWTSFPGIREIAVFSAVGVATALLIARLALPPFMRAGGSASPPQRALAHRLGGLLEALRAHPRRTLLLFAVPLLMAGTGIPRLQWVDQLSALNQLNPDLLAEDARVRGRVSRMEAGQIVVVSGSSEEEALQRNDQAFTILSRSTSVEGFRSLHSLLWSAKLQRENASRFSARDTLDEDLQKALTEAGFHPKPFAGAFTSPALPPLTYANLLASPLAALIRPFRADIEGEVSFFTFVRGVSDPHRLAEELSVVPGARYFDQQAFLSSAYRTYRKRALELVGVGLVLVFLLILGKYRSPRLALAAFVPAFVAAVGTLGLLGLVGLEANLMHLVALLLVLSIGVDYGVFMVEHRRETDRRAASLTSIAIACLTTVFSFGTLALSANPALRALGVAVATGVVLAMALAPAALGFFAKDGAS